MSKEEVLQVMGTQTIQTYRLRQGDPLYDWASGTHVRLYKLVRYRTIPHPYRSESVRAPDGSDAEILYYYARHPTGDDRVTDDELTPVVLEADNLVGWGWSYLEKHDERYPAERRTK
jgi:hypothetical protein